MRPPGAGRGRAGRPRGVQRRRWRRRRGGAGQRRARRAVPRLRTQAANWGSTSPRRAQSSSVAESRVVRSRAPATTSSTSGVATRAARCIASQPASTSSPSGVSPSPRPSSRAAAAASRRPLVDVFGDEPGHRGRGGGLNGDRVRRVGRSVTERRYVRSHQPADRQRTTADVELPTPKVRRDTALGDGGLDRPDVGNPYRARHLGGGRTDHPDAPAADLDVDRVGAGVEHRHGAVGGGLQPVAHAGRGAGRGHGTRR